MDKELHGLIDEMPEHRDLASDMEKISVLTTKNYCVSGSKDQIIDYLKNTNIKSIYVDKIRLSSLN